MEQLPNEMDHGGSDEGLTAELNPAQAEAVGSTNGPLLVFAGAGSGKTRVITYRVAHLVASYRVAPYRVLAVTFTNKAAAEMRSRLERLLGSDIARDLWVGTFHATCVRLLRRYHEAAGLGPNFVIYDDADQRAVASRVLKELDLDDRRYPPKMILSRIHKEKQEGRGPSEMVLKDFADDQVVRVYERYERHLAEANALDFEDLILRMTKLVEGDTREAEELRHRFEYVLVDEFQDTNHIQYRLVRELARVHRNLCVVGDDDQSIYRWRGADIRNIRGFRKDFPEALVVKLEQNYRSSARIVRAALAVIRSSRHREPKELWTANDDGAKVVVAQAGNEREEAAFLVARVRELIAAGTAPNEIAIFYRIHAQSRVLEEAFRADNVPYQIVGGTKFFDRAEVKDLLSYLRVLLNPQSDVDLLRVINVPARGIGTTTVDRLVALADDRGASVFEVLELAAASSGLGAAAKKKLTAFRALLQSLGNQVFALRPSEAAALVLEETGYRRALQTEDTAESDARLENLEELVGSILDYEEEAHAAGEAATLAGYLERVTLASDVDQLKDAPRIVLMTVHGAKGLEFQHVFLTGMEDELFPYKGLAPGEEEELEEERRLAYVAITRARQRLVITHAAVRTLFGQVRYCRRSRFLASLPADDIEWIGGTSPSLSRFIDREDWSVRTRRDPHPTPPPFDVELPDAEDGRTMRVAYDADESGGRPAASDTLTSRAAGERYVDRTAFDDEPAATDDGEITRSERFRRGSRVRHARFGEGEVRRVESAAELMVIAYFPGWGEKKILARFLQLAS